MSRDTLGTLQIALSARYRVERLLGSGGMATVYLAHDLKHDRPVAIKVLRPELATVIGPARFLQEIQIAARLTHPHVLPLHDSGDASGLLYYVMPYVAGESLHDRIVREKQLSIEEAVRITREVASALAYAHGQDVVHRDIKPGNILLADGSALVADFGLAKATSHAASSVSISHSGLTIGTPAYMSPEQASGEGPVDGRSDVYALGCVLYEMLAGDPPFVSSNPAAVLARHAAAPVLPIRIARPSVPPWLDRALQRSLEKVPADRFQTAEEFAQALQAPATAPARVPRWVVALAVVAVLALALWRIGPGPSAPVAAVDTARYAVLPFQVSGQSAEGFVGEVMLQDALGRWDGVHLVDRFQINDAMARLAGRPLTNRVAEGMARDLRAGHFIRGEVSPAPDGTRVQAVLFQTDGGREIRQRTIRLPPSTVPGDSVFRILADGLLFGDDIPKNREAAGPGTNSAPARQEYARGLAGITEWDLGTADSAFIRALRYDPGYAQASLWLGLSRMWAGLPRSAWQAASEQAATGRLRLASRDRVMADAVVQMNRREYATACPLWERLTKAGPEDFAVWYGLATCLSSDRGVLRDTRSISSWRFRSSMQQAQTAYRKAFQLLPSIHRGLRGGGFQEFRRLLITSLTFTRPGEAVPPDTGRFQAYPSWEGDTLLLTPYPAAEIQMARVRRSSTALEALAHQRQSFYEITHGWVAAYPNSPDALEALGFALELLGNSTAIDTVRKARRLAQDRETRSRTAATETWMRLRIALPSNLQGLRIVQAMTDSLLRGASTASAEEASLLVPLALLAGRGNLAAQLSRRAGDLRGDVPAAVAGDALALIAYASLAAPAESLAALEARVEAGILQAMDKEQQTRSRPEWIGRPASMTYPVFKFKGLQSLAGQNDYLLDAQSAFERGQPRIADSLLAGVRSGGRAGFPASMIMLDALLPEAQLLTLMGKREAAIAELDSTLIAQRFIAPHLMADIARAGMLVRAMAWRADMAAEMGDTLTARLWANPVAILWAGADPYLQRTVQRMVQFTAR